MDLWKVTFLADLAKAIAGSSEPIFFNDVKN